MGISGNFIENFSFRHNNLDNYCHLKREIYRICRKFLILNHFNIEIFLSNSRLLN
jgi:hypothetical protein